MNKIQQCKKIMNRVTDLVLILTLFVFLVPGIAVTEFIKLIKI